MWESQSMGGGSSGKGQKERDKQTLSWAGSWHRARTQDPRILIWAEGRHLTDWATQVALKSTLFKEKVFVYTFYYSALSSTIPWT